MAHIVFSVVVLTVAERVHVRRWFAFLRPLLSFPFLCLPWSLSLTHCQRLIAGKEQSIQMPSEKGRPDRWRVRSVYLYRSFIKFSTLLKKVFLTWAVGQVVCLCADKLVVSCV